MQSKLGMKLKLPTLRKDDGWNFCCAGEKAFESQRSPTSPTTPTSPQPSPFDYAPGGSWKTINGDSPPVIRPLRLPAPRVRPKVRRSDSDELRRRTLVRSADLAESQRLQDLLLELEKFFV